MNTIPTKPWPDVMSIQQAAEYAGLSKSAIHKARKEDKLGPRTQRGGNGACTITKEALDAWLLTPEKDK